MPATSFHPPPQETPAERDERVRMINARIAAGQAEIDAGLGLDWDDVEAWLNLLDTDPDAPMPKPRATILSR
jgi:predicted transcriptional regulator